MASHITCDHLFLRSPMALNLFLRLFREAELSRITPATYMSIVLDRSTRLLTRETRQKLYGVPLFFRVLCIKREIGLFYSYRVVNRGWRFDGVELV